MRETPLTRKPPARPPRQVDDLIFAICTKYFLQRMKTEDIAKWVRARLEERNETVSFSRQQVYSVLYEAIGRELIRFTPPADQRLAQRLADLANTVIENVTVSNLDDVYDANNTVNGMLAGVAADTLLRLIKERGAPEDEPARAVHIGLGAGTTTMRVARQLAALLRQEYELPGVSEIVLHALSTGFLLDQPESEPGAFYHYFTGSVVRVSCVGLLSEPFILARKFARHRTHPGVKESYDRAVEIEIFITSLGTADDEHGLLNRAEARYDIQRRDIQRGAPHHSDNDGNGHPNVERVGDVQYRPFSAEGPIQEAPDEHRAVTLFDLEEFVRLTQEQGRDLILVSGPTATGATRTRALMPLLTRKNLRVWTHLCLDRATAKEVVDELEARRRQRASVEQARRSTFDD